MPWSTVVPLWSRTTNDIATVATLPLPAPVDGSVTSHVVVAGRLTGVGNEAVVSPRARLSSWFVPSAQPRRTTAGPSRRSLPAVTVLVTWTVPRSRSLVNVHEAVGLRR